jgi:hypothetical protein
LKFLHIAGHIQNQMELIGTEREPTRILDSVEKGSYNDTAKRCFHEQCGGNSNKRLCTVESRIVIDSAEKNGVLTMLNLFLES